jgi:cyclic AMP-dependent transcription factor ATF-2
MSSKLLPAHSSSDSHHCESGLRLDMASEICNLYTTQRSWDPSLQLWQPGTTTTNYTSTSTPSAPILLDDKMPHLDAQSSYPLPSTYPAIDTIPLSQDITTISPTETCFDSDTSPRQFCNSPMSCVSSGAPSTDLPDNKRPYAMHGSNASQSSHKSKPTTTIRGTAGRKRKSESVEPESARAVYLEKNRMAASKCRNKQKRQQEDLVEQARSVERRNKILKVEVNLLRNDMCELMNLVGQHTNCLDMRISSYIQREADRLSAVGVSTSSFVCPPKRSPDPHRSLSPFTTSSPNTSLS